MKVRAYFVSAAFSTLFSPCGESRKKSLVKIFLLLLTLCLFSCASSDKQEDPLAPRRSTGEIRIDDIKEQVAQDPVRAIDLIGSYREMYRITEEAAPASSGEEAESAASNESSASYEAGISKDIIELAAMEKEAIENLGSLLEKAISEERWDDAVSYNRSMASLQLPGAANREQEFILAGAKKKLADGNNLGAFLAAVQAHELRRLSPEDALLFLDKAVSVKQRGTAAYFLAAMEQAGAAGKVPAAFREYAKGSDTVGDMLKGVATVLIDRGIKIERGRGFADKSLGSAFFIDSSGLMITNYHVIESEVDTKYKGYSRMYIRMGDAASPRIPARVIGWDKMMDLALIKTEYTSEYVFSIVDRVIPHVGDTVLAIGSPAGLEKTVTSGIVSSLSRRFFQVGDVFQIDAAVNPGNSGGPVVDSSGRLVGVVFAGSVPPFEGLNFAVPAQRLAAALPAMIQGGKAERPWLGMALSETISGAEIIYVAPNTPVARHRVSEGSIIKTLNGREIQAAQSLLIPALQDAIFQSRPGELVALETQNPSGEVKRRLVMTVPRPELPLGDAAKIDSRERLVAPLFGMILSPAQTKSWVTTYQVKKIVRGSIADEANISEQDPIAIRGFKVYEKEGYALMEINIKKRSMGYLETTMTLPAYLDSPDTL